MFFVLLYTSLIAHVAGDLSDFQKSNPNTIDLSSMKVCYVHGASKVADVDSQQDMGHKCTVTLDTWTEDSKQAKELCESRFPYYIIDSKPGSGTTCTFQINLQCDNDYVQINQKCYKVLSGRYTLPDAEKNCNVNKHGSQGRLAEFYSQNLELFFDQIDGIYDAWVTVPNMKDYYDNGKDLSIESKYGKNAHPNNYAAPCIQDSSFEFDVRKGTIMMDKENSFHQAICEYTPPMTRAEMFYLAKVYSEIYPFEVFNGGAIIPTANFMTIKQVTLSAATDKKGNPIPGFNTSDFDAVCMNIGRILNVQSYPMTAIENEFNDVKDVLQRHRFYLTNAYKNDGCFKKDYLQISGGKSYPLFTDGASGGADYCEAHSLSFTKETRHPTMAAMRAPLLCALHTFNFKYGQCAPAPAWSEPPIRYDRKTRVMCHYIDNKNVYTHEEAIRVCEKMDAALTGFDSEDEFDQVRSKLKPLYPPGSRATIDNGRDLPGIFHGQEPVDDHFWLGGQSPCLNACDNHGEAKKHVASWENGVADNNDFLSTAKHVGWDWEAREFIQYVSFRTDASAFHVHKIGDPYEKMFMICGKSAELEKGDKQKGSISTSG